MSFKIIDRKDLPVESIELSSKNPRKHFRGAAMEELKKSIIEMGLIQPILVKIIGNNHYETIAGNRRLFAFQELEKETIPAIIIEADSEITENDIALIENLIRDDLSPIEEAKAYMNRWKLMGYKIHSNLNESEIATELSKKLPPPKTRIYKRLCLLRLPKTIQNRIHLKKFKKTYGYEISRLPTQKDMTELYNRIKANKKNWNLILIKETVDEILKEKDSETGLQKSVLEKMIKTLREGLVPLKDKRNKILKDYLKFYKAMGKELKDDDIEITAPNELEEIIGDYCKKLKKENQEAWKEFQNQVENIQKRLNSISALLSQVEELDIDTCPFCEAGIDIEAIKRREEHFEDNLKEIEQDQANLNEYLAELNKLHQDFERAKVHLIKQQTEIIGQLKEIVKKRREIKDLEVSKNA